MILKQLLEKWGLSSLKINAGFLQAEWKPQACALHYCTYIFSSAAAWPCQVLLVHIPNSKHARADDVDMLKTMDTHTLTRLECMNE